MAQKHDPAVLDRLLALRDREGLTYAELEERSGVPAGTLASWRSKTTRHPRASPADSFTELVVVDGEGGAAPAAGSVVEIEGPRGHVVRVTQDTDDGLLRRVLAALSC